MPLYRHKGEFYYFAHVPKCGGKSVESYLAARWGDAAFLDDVYFGKPPHQRWLRASPQHATWEDFRKIFREDWISASFAVVRHPLARLVSEYNYLVRVRQVLPRGMGFASWLSELKHLIARRPFAYDNHIRPQSDFVPDDARVFRLEDGLDKLVPFIDELSGDADGPRDMGRLHQTREYSQRATRQEPVNQAAAAKFVERFYRADLDRFGYDATQPDELIAHVPVARARAFQPLLHRSRLMRRLARYRRPHTDLGES